MQILRNNVIWLIVATGGASFLGLVIAGLFDRVRREALAKTFVFLPLAISLIGASVIWRFVYAWQPPGQPQIGLLNAVMDGLRRQPDRRGSTTSPINIFCRDRDHDLAPDRLRHGRAVGRDQGRLDRDHRGGAPRRRHRAAALLRGDRAHDPGLDHHRRDDDRDLDLKIFDIVYVMTGGQFDDDVVANRMFNEMFQFFNDGRAAALATLLFLAVLPVMYINLRNFRDSRWKHDRRSRNQSTKAGGRVGLAARRSSAALPLRIAVVAHLRPVDAAHARSARDLVPATGADHADGLVGLRCSIRSQRTSGRSPTTSRCSAREGMGNAFLNSLIVTIPSTVIPITIAAFAAYAFAWIPFRGRGILFTIVVGAARRADPDVADPDPPASTAARA